LSEGLGPLPDTAYVLAREGTGYEPEYLLSEAGYSDDQMRAYALDAVQRAVAAMMSRCQGKKHDGCNYLAHCGMVCNKCGQVA
jgi:hypothetical protein